MAQQVVMVIVGLRQSQQHLQQAMDCRGVQQVFAAHDMGDTLECIVDDN